jgi:hypothetical protein
VMSALFGTMRRPYGSSDEQTRPQRSDSEGEAPERAAAIMSLGATQSTRFKSDEPLPSSVEEKILGVQIMLRQATERL